MSDLQQALRQGARGLAPGAILAQPVTDLVGVGADAAQALQAVGIHTVLDLGASALFGLAQRIALMADGDDGLGNAGPLPADMLDDVARGLSASDVARGELSQLRMLNLTQSRVLARALAAPTVRDLGLWPPALSARRLVQWAVGATVPDHDPEAPSELQPRMGQLPVDRVQYSRLLFESLLADLPAVLGAPPAQGDGTPDNPAKAPPPEVPASPPDFDKHYGPRGYGVAGLGEGQEWPLDLTEAVLGRGFEQPGFGMRVTLAQTWTPVGLSLGQLLHSVALAPGEATRVAIVDWARTVGIRTTEEITEDERLKNELGRKRSLSEVTRAVASEMQSGESNFDMMGASWGLGIAAAGEYKGVSAAANFGYSRTDAKGSAFSSSSGQRDVSADLSQEVQDRTEQNASFDRGRRASVVSEVGVKEAETLTTRVVANYNHMHALSVLYFEVVQIYRARTEVVDVEPLLYLPVKPFDFDHPELVERYRGVLAEVALNPSARRALLGLDDAPPPPAAAATPGVAELVFGGRAGQEHPYLGNTALDAAGLRLALGPAAAFDRVQLTLRSDQAALVEIQFTPVYDAEKRLVGQPYTDVVVQSEGAPLTLPVLRWAVERPRLGDDAPEGSSPWPYQVQLGGTAQRLGPWGTLQATRSSNVKGDASFFVHFLFCRLDAAGRPTGDPVRFRASHTLADGETSQRLLTCRFKPDAPTVAKIAEPAFDLSKHLRANALHYTMALLRRADPALLGLTLGRLQILGQALLSQVDPVPVAHAGNYLVFRWARLSPLPEWQDLLKRRGLAPQQCAASARSTLVPMASGGVFAEAVLGRFNSAEKLDLTRFWNWQDSPTPLVPPEIAPLQAGLRRGADALTPGSLGPATLRQQDAPAVPDPGKAVADILSAVTKGDSFRNMSGIDALLTQGGQAMTLSAQGAREFMAKAMETVSAYGARVNHGRNMDERAKQDAAKAGASGGAPAAGGGKPGPDAKGGQGSGAATGGAGSGTGDRGAGGAVGGAREPGAAGGGTGGATGGDAARAGGTGGTAGPGPHESGAFDGPKPEAPAPEQRPAPPSARRWHLSVKTERVNDQDSVISPLDIDGKLELGGLPLDLSGLPLPGGERQVDPLAMVGEAEIRLSSGVGTATLSLAPDAPDDLAPTVNLRVARLGDVDVRLSGDPVPGTDDSWAIDFLQRLCELHNRVPVASKLLAWQEGKTTRLAICGGLVNSTAMKVRLMQTGQWREEDPLVPESKLSLEDLIGSDAERRLTVEKRVAEASAMRAFRRDLVERCEAAYMSGPLTVVMGIHLHHDAAMRTIRLRFPLAVVQALSLR